MASRVSPVLKPLLARRAMSDQITTFRDSIVPDGEEQVTRLVERLRPFDLISTVRERTAFPGSLLRRLPNLKLLLATGTQFENFDLKTARERGIPVVAAPGLGRTDQRNSVPARLGRLGAAVARIGHLAWGMRVVCWSANLTQEKADQMAADVGLDPDNGVQDGKTFKVVSKDELFRDADVVSLQYVLSARSRAIVGAKELHLMKKSALLVNASRGPVIDQAALLNTLERGEIRGAALDVFDVEPLPLTSPWRQDRHWGQNDRSHLLTTPHMGYVDEGLMNTWYAESAENVERWLDGEEVLHRLV
ncbi:D-isomer specific 2-hydroxyacid dehydrogenase [Seiridium cupressi]